MVIIVPCLLVKNKSISLKLIIKIMTFEFCLGSISNGFGTVDFREVSLKGNMYNFSVDYNSVDKSDISV